MRTRSTWRAAAAGLLLAVICPARRLLPFAARCARRRLHLAAPSARRLLPVAALILLLLPAGCAGGEQGNAAAAAPGRTPRADEVRLVVSRDFGKTILVDVTTPVGDDMSVMRLLARNADVGTAYSGGFVKSIDGLSSTFGSVTDAEAQDWFYWVDGIMADVGAADYDLHGGQTAWWDYHAWSQAMYLPAAVFALPAPWTGDDVPLTMNGDDAAVRTWAAESGISLAAVEKLGREAPRSGMVVATAAEAEATPWLAHRLAGDDGGVELIGTGAGGLTLKALDGATGPRASGACMALPNPDDGDSPLLLLITGDADDLEPLLAAVSPASVNARVGVALIEDETVLLPWHAK